MRILTWNCNGAFRKKFHRLAPFKADILVIQECENPAETPSIAYQEWSANYCWRGNNKHKGLGIFCRSDISLQALEWPDHGLEQFLPLLINQEITLLAVWTKFKARESYIGQLWRYLQLNGDRLAAKKQIICGDFNSNTIWDKQRRNGNHSHLVEELQRRNIISAYHALTKELQGDESQATFFLHRDQAKPYHIDYIFTASDLLTNHSKINIGKAAAWLAYSDHMPVMLSLCCKEKLRSSALCGGRSCGH